MKSDVVVIGAGPAGSTAADLIAGKGYNVILIDKDEYPGKNNICGGGLSEQFAEKIKLDEDVIEKRISYEMHFFPWAVHKWSQKHVTVHRNIFDKYLAEKAVENGAKLLTSTEAVDFQKKDNIMHVTVIDRKNNNRRSELSCNIVIFADGVNTLVSRKNPGLGFRRDRKNTGVGMIYELEWKNNPMDWYEIFFNTKYANWGYGWVFPKKDIINVGVGCLVSKLDGSIQKKLDSLILHNPIVSKKLKNLKVLRRKSAMIPMVIAERLYDEGILIAGDSGGMVDPLFGCGIERAYEAGKLAGNVSANALERSDYSINMLSEYQTAWEKNPYSRSMKYHHLICKFLLPVSNIDKNVLFKFMDFYCNRQRFNYGEMLRMLFYPFFGSKIQETNI